MACLDIGADLQAKLSCLFASVDWVGFSEVARNLTLTAAGAVGAIIAWRGLSAWKNQKQWEYKAEVLEKIRVSLRSYFEALDTLHKYDRMRSRMQAKTKEVGSGDLAALDQMFRKAISAVDDAYLGGTSVSSDVAVLFDEAVLLSWQDFQQEIRKLIVQSDKFAALTGIPNMDFADLQKKLISVEVHLLREVYLKK